MNASTDTRQPGLLKVVVALLVIAAVVLLGLLQAAHSDNGVKVLDVGDHRDLSPKAYAVGHTVELPGGAITVAVAPPVQELDAGMVEAVDDDQPSDPRNQLETWRAPEGGSLVPITWRVHERTYFGEQALETPLQIRLVAGDQQVDAGSVDLSSSDGRSDALLGVSRVYSLDGELELGDLRIEVEFDGMTQVVDPATADIDTGLAEPLYGEESTFDTGCRTTADDCEFHAVDPHAPIRPTYAGFEARDLELHPYDSKLGWAEEGRLWATTTILSFGGVGTDADGNDFSMTRHGPLQLRLDGEKAVQRRDLRQDDMIASGTMVFSVDADATPTELEIRSWYRLSNGTRLPVTRTLQLHSVES